MCVCGGGVLGSNILCHKIQDNYFAIRGLKASYLRVSETLPMEIQALQYSRGFKARCLLVCTGDPKYLTSLSLSLAAINPDANISERLCWGHSQIGKGQCKHLSTVLCYNRVTEQNRVESSLVPKRVKHFLCEYSIYIGIGIASCTI